MTLQACADIVQRGDPDRFLGIMAAPVAARAVLFPLYAFNIEVTRAPWLTAEPIIAEMRLQWWRDVLDEIARGQPPRAHEVVAPLAEVLDPAVIPDLDALIDARRRDIDGAAFDDDAALWTYLEETGGRLTWAGMRLLGVSDDLRDTVLRAGSGAALARYLMAIPALENAGRLPLPDGRVAAVEALAVEGLNRWEAARTTLRAMLDTSRCAPLLVDGWQTGAVLRRARANPERVGQGRLPLSPFRAKLALIAQA